uniref:MAT-alpha1 superfamily protein n=1 Tax=Cordyceps cicadae TaxID=218633 RepID=A0A0K1U4I6_9HYPO|nr:MAT-alpha1 superfamily protein [Cordyceps cicadae]
MNHTSSPFSNSIFARQNGAQIERAWLPRAVTASFDSLCTHNSPSFAGGDNFRDRCQVFRRQRSREKCSATLQRSIGVSEHGDAIRLTQEEIQPQASRGPRKATIECFYRLQKQAQTIEMYTRPDLTLMVLGYYVKLFPESQQKAASGFLTTLWSKDPYRNRWAMIAKVYSFVRDEMGKKRAPLSSFLMAACPAMDILPPDEYLRVLGWVVEDTEHGTKRLVQRDELRAPKATTRPCPDSELELFQGMIELGYMPDENVLLLEALLAQDSRSALTSTISISERASIKSDQELYQQDLSEGVPASEIERSPTYLDGSIYSPSLEASTPSSGTPRLSEDTATPSTCTSISTPTPQPSALAASNMTPSQSMGMLSAVPVSTTEPMLGTTVSASYYPSYHYNPVTGSSISCPPASSFVSEAGLGASNNHYPGYVATVSSPAILSLDGVADHQAFDIDCPWDVDAMLSQCTQPSGDQTFLSLAAPSTIRTMTFTSRFELSVLFLRSLPSVPWLNISCLFWFEFIRGQQPVLVQWRESAEKEIAERSARIIHGWTKGVFRCLFYFCFCFFTTAAIPPRESIPRT